MLTSFSVYQGFFFKWHSNVNVYFIIPQEGLNVEIERLGIVTGKLIVTMKKIAQKKQISIFLY